MSEAGQEEPRGAAFVARVLRDPYYESAYRVLRSFAAVEDAGFFDDGEERVAPAGLEWMSTPVEKVRRRSARCDAERAVVLLMTGSFNPVHAGHLEAMEVARRELEARGYFVAGGYLSPSHDGYVASKVAGALSAAERLQLCQVATADSEWLMTADWEALGVDRAVNFTDVIVWLEAYLARHVASPRPLEVVYVFGGDHARFSRTFVGRGMCVCTFRPGYAAEVERYAGDPQVAGNPRIIFAMQGQAAASSSDIVQQGRVELMEARSRGAYERLLAARAGAASRVVYTLRDERGWEALPWLAGRDAALLLNEREVLREQLAGLIREAHARAGNAVEIRWIGVDAQREEVAGLSGALLSLDALIEGAVDLGVSRCFPLSGAWMASELTHRPGCAPLAEQIGAIPDGEYVLVDDDVSTGATLRAIVGMLGEGVRVARVHVLVREARQAGELREILDLRDFVAGSRHGGLVVRLADGEAARAPYCLPYVSASERASIPLGEELVFCREVWRMNERFFRRVEPAIALGEADPAFRRLMRGLGFVAADSLAAICRWHAEQLQRTIERAEVRRGGGRVP
ncbi:MAG: hypothetical protein JNL82_22655 [Myxococcales bacterium]|nr:hypothetical protein [Myxococcales bacterium]